MKKELPKAIAAANDPPSVRDCFLEAFEESLQAQLKAIRRLRLPKAQEHGPGAANKEPLGRPSKRGMSQVSMAIHILESAGTPLHITSLLERIHQHFGRRVDRESLVSSLSKRVARQERLVRTARNTFALVP